MLDVLARDVHVALELVAARAVGFATNTCRNAGITSRADLPGTSASTGHVAPAEHREALVEQHLLDRAHRAVEVVDREERDAGRVRAGGRQVEGHDGPEERVGGLDRDARAVAGVGLGAGRAAVVQAAHRGERLVEDRVALAALHVDDEADAAAVVLEARVVETLRHGEVGVRVRSIASIGAAVAFGHVGSSSSRAVSTN